MYADSGGTTRDASIEAFFVPFQRDTGIKVVSADLDNARFELMSKRSSSQWDAAEYGAIDTVDAKDRRLLEDYPAGTKASNSVPEADRRVQTGVFWASMNLVYRPEAFRGQKPESWADFWNVSKFPGRRVMRKSPIWVVEAALLADGVGVDQIQPYDFDQAFAKLDELRPHLTFVDSGAEVQQLLQTGDAEIAQLACGRAYALEQEGVKLGMSWDRALQYGWHGPVMPHGAPNPDAMAELAAYMTAPKRQAKFASLTGYGPANTAALDMLETALLEKLPNSPEHLEAGFTYDFQVAADQRPEYAERMVEFLADG